MLRVVVVVSGSQCLEVCVLEIRTEPRTLLRYPLRFYQYTSVFVDQVTKKNRLGLGAIDLGERI